MDKESADELAGLVIICVLATLFWAIIWTWWFLAIALGLCALGYLIYRIHTPLSNWIYRKANEPKK